jgi:hypothetical protein
VQPIIVDAAAGDHPVPRQSGHESGRVDLAAATRRA